MWDRAYFYIYICFLTKAKWSKILNRVKIVIFIKIISCCLWAWQNPFFFSDRPDRPINVEVDRCRLNSVDLKWTKGMENNAPSNYFIVQYNTSFNSDQWVSAKTVDSTQNTANIVLRSWANYTFRVIATNKIGQSFPSLHTKKVCTIYPDRPEKNPSNVRSIGNLRGYLVIEWTVGVINNVI